MSSKEKTRLLLNRCEESEIQAMPLSDGMCFASTSRSPLSDGYNQDSLLLQQAKPSDGIIAVADGVGGSKAGDQASRLALEAIAKEVDAVTESGGSLRSAIIDGFERANREVLALGLGAATTLAVVEIAGRSIRSYHAGDSFVLLVGQRGKLKYQTIDHSPVGYALEAGLVEDSDAMSHSERHIITNFIGFDDMRIAVGPTLELQAKDTLIVASDGVSDNLSVPEITETIRSGDPMRCSTNLKQHCHERMKAQSDSTYGKPDDLSFAVYRPGMRSL